MKKTSVNRRKKLPLLLGALLIISVAAYGTRAYFSDSAEQQANIALELGNVDITMENTKGWVYTPLNGTKNTTIDSSYIINEKLGASVNVDGYIENKEVTNVRPGDSFTKKFIITNKGTLDVKLKTIIDGNSLKETLNENDDVKVEITEFNENTILASSNLDNLNSSTTYTVQITINPDLDNKYNNNDNENLEFDTNSFNGLALDYTAQHLSVTATQTNNNQ